MQAIKYLGKTTANLNVNVWYSFNTTVSLVAQDLPNLYVLTLAYSDTRCMKIYGRVIRRIMHSDVVASYTFTQMKQTGGFNNTSGQRIEGAIIL